MTSPIYYETLEDQHGNFAVPSGSNFLGAIYVFDELRVYYLASHLGARVTYNYEIVATGNAPKNNTEYVLTFNPDYKHVFHLFIEKEFVKPILTGGFASTSIPVETSTKLPTVVSLEDHRQVSVIYRKKDGSTRLMRLSNVAFGVKNGRQTMNGLDAEKSYEYREIYCDMIEEWVTVE